MRLITKEMQKVYVEFDMISISWILESYPGGRSLKIGALEGKIG
jgi:hypothetical protein